MACRLVGAKLLSEPMLRYCSLDPQDRNSYIFVKENTFESVVCKMSAILPQCVNRLYSTAVVLSHLFNIIYLL